MTNLQRYRTPEARAKAFWTYCNKHECKEDKALEKGKKKCPLDKSSCMYAWLELDYDGGQDLMPCPFCGGSPIFLTEEENGRSFFTIKCECGIQTRRASFPLWVEDTWNRRVQ